MHPSAPVLCDARAPRGPEHPLHLTPPRSASLRLAPPRSASLRLAPSHSIAMGCCHRRCDTKVPVAPPCCRRLRTTAAAAAAAVAAITATTITTTTLLPPPSPPSFASLLPLLPLPHHCRRCAATAAPLSPLRRHRLRATAPPPSPSGRRPLYRPSTPALHAPRCHLFGCAARRHLGRPPLSRNRFPRPSIQLECRSRYLSSVHPLRTSSLPEAQLYLCPRQPLPRHSFRRDRS